MILITSSLLVDFERRIEGDLWISLKSTWAKEIMAKTYREHCELGPRLIVRFSFAIAEFRVSVVGASSSCVLIRHEWLGIHIEAGSWLYHPLLIGEVQLVRVEGWLRLPLEDLREEVNLLEAHDLFN